MGRQPSPREHQRRPPRVPGENQGGRDASDHLHHAGSDEVHGDRHGRSGHPAVELASHGEIGRERGILQVRDARRPDTGFCKPVIEPRRGTVSQIGAERLMNGAQHLQQYENGAGQGERAGQRTSLLHSANQHTHGNREQSRQHSAQQESRPPARCENRVRLRQDAEELPFVALGYNCEHQSILPQIRFWCPYRARAHDYGVAPLANGFAS